jgi:hypothetical protein
MRRPVAVLLLVGVCILFSNWGFFAHQRINRLAVFLLPPEMIGFYKANIQYITEAAVNPDRRRYSVVDEAPRHYIDLDHYGDSAMFTMPFTWQQAVSKYSEDTLKKYGIAPWHINRMYYSLRDAFMLRDPDLILKRSADLGHYIADAHVPLHTTENYNGLLTNQEGIHAFWESRLPELYSDDFNFLVGRAAYIPNPQLAAWSAIQTSHMAVDSVLSFERELSEKMGERKYTFETKGKQTVKVYSQPYARAYYLQLHGMVERRMRAAIKSTGDFWYTAWVDGGQPDLNELIGYTPTEVELAQRRQELERWKERIVKSRDHETEK